MALQYNPHSSTCCSGVTILEVLPEHKVATCRENTEGEYSGLEHEVVPDVVESLKVITQVGLHPCPAGSSVCVGATPFLECTLHRRDALKVLHGAARDVC